ncbi:MAG: response regulator transcription factor [Chloroflexi bacterium]|nr:response regulator transcription factor [Chloroflexota bacterium]
MARSGVNPPVILIIDDDLTLTTLLSEHLAAAGYQPLSANDGERGLSMAADHEPTLVVLDVMMPKMDGWKVCERLRESSAAPIIMLTAKSEEFDKLRGFHLGIDDYVTKPFSFAELTARIGAVLARANRGDSPTRIVASENLTIDLGAQRVTIDRNAIDLTPIEYRLLEALAKNAPRTVPTERLLEIVWGAAYAGEMEHVKHYIWALRKKLEADPGNPKHILTERGFGYRFE